MSAGRLRAALCGIAAGGLMAGHWAVYLLRAPDAHERAHLLAATGHGVLPQLGAIAVAAALTGLVALPWGTSAEGRLRPLARQLAALQCGGFLALELTERLLAHDGGAIAGLLGDPTMAAGIAIQIPIAMAIALLLSLLLRLVPAAPPPAPHSSTGRRLAAPAVLLPRPQRPGQDARSLRGPPLHARP